MTEVAINDDFCSKGSEITYWVTDNVCTQYCLRIGCSGMVSCATTVTGTSYNVTYDDNNVPTIKFRNATISNFGGSYDKNGSVFNIDGRVNVEVTDMVFADNRGFSGAVFYLRRINSFIATDTLFIRNSASSPLLGGGKRSHRPHASRQLTQSML